MTAISTPPSALRPPPSLRPGYKTTEFYAHCAVTLGTIILTCAGIVPGKTAVICVTVSSCLYLAARFTLKALGQPAGDVPALPVSVSPFVARAEQIEGLGEAVLPLIQAEIKSALVPAKSNEAGTPLPTPAPAGK